MQLPVDIVALFEDVANLETASEEPLAVSIYIDESAPDDIAAYVRNAFASTSEHVRMTVAYVGEEFVPHPTDDIAVLVAGDTGVAGQQAKAVRDVGVPVMVVTLDPARTTRISENAGFPIPLGDTVSPWGDDAENAENTGVRVFGDEAIDALNERMGRWIVAVCRTKKLAFAIAFPFMRRSLAKDSVQVTALENAGIGIIPLPAADLPLMTLNQAKMALQIAAAYGQEMDKERIKEIVVVVGGAYLSRSIARKIVSYVPVLGAVLKPCIAFGSTMAMGYGLIEYFEGGEDVTGVASVIESATEKGGGVMSFVGEKVNTIAPKVSKALAKS